MNEEGMRRVLRDRGLSLRCDRRLSDTIYCAVGQPIDGSKFQRYLGTSAALSPMDSKTFAALVAEKTNDYIGTSRKCAIVSCTQRRGKANRVVLTTTFGEVAVWLCNEHYKDFQDSL